jgi:hypothetical protein
VVNMTRALADLHRDGDLRDALNRLDEAGDRPRR